MPAVPPLARSFSPVRPPEGGGGPGGAGPRPSSRRGCEQAVAGRGAAAGSAVDARGVCTRVYTG